MRFTLWAAIILGMTAALAPAQDHHYTIAMMPKSKGNAYFIACHKGADKAASASRAASIACPANAFA